MLPSQLQLLHLAKLQLRLLWMAWNYLCCLQMPQMLPLQLCKAPVGAVQRLHHFQAP